MSNFDRHKARTGSPSLSRRTLIKAGAGAMVLPPTVLAAAAQAAEASNRILVVLELSGGNDGLNTLVPYTNDAYYRLRPNIGIKPDKLRKIDGRFGFSPGMAGFERLYKDGQMAIVHGCGYDNPSFSHFTSMAYYHTGAPNSGEPYGWVGKLADNLQPGSAPHFIVNVDATQSLAVRSAKHTPVVFDDPSRFSRRAPHLSRGPLGYVADPEQGNESQRFLRRIAVSARDASVLVRDAWRAYQSPVDYGLQHLDLPKIVALIEAGLPTRLYYTSFRNNAFDTHVHQPNLHARLLTYASDAVSAFMQDLERIGRADDVALLVFSEFGRRVPENTSLGTDHGTANSMYLIGKGVRGGHYGEPPDLEALDEGDNFVHTTDFRRVYATVMEQWMGLERAGLVLKQDFPTFPVFA